MATEDGKLPGSPVSKAIRVGLVIIVVGWLLLGVNLPVLVAVLLSGAATVVILAWPYPELREWYRRRKQ